jgi:DNA-binding protein HU-beta
MTGEADRLKQWAAGGECDEQERGQGDFRVCEIYLRAGLPSMNRKELVDALATRTGSSRADSDRAVGVLLEVISEALVEGESISLTAFGTFEVRERPTHKGRNPRTGEELQIAASKIPAFKAGATLKTAVNGK